MQVGIYSVFDSVTGAFLQPFFSVNDDSAKRAFREACNDGGMAFFKHSADYTLFRVGSFDDDTGKVTAQDTVSLGNGIMFKDNIQ